MTEICIRVSKKEMKDIRQYTTNNKVSISHLVRDTTNNLVIEEYDTLCDIILNCSDKYPSIKGIPRDYALVVDISSLNQYILKTLCSSFNTKYTRVIRNLILDEIYK